MPRRLASRVRTLVRRVVLPAPSSAPRIEPHPVGTNPDVLAMVRDLIAATDRPTILELGARRVGVDQGLREMLGISGQEHTYIGADLYAAPGVDVVGDLHQLSRLMKRRSVDFVVSKSVFEHLAIPWKVILEINAILREGGYLFINTEQTFPLHELPWDFFRFSDRAWAAMVNAATGYEIVATELNAPCRVVPETPIDGWSGEHAAFINSNLLARKIGGYDRRRVRWDLQTSEVAAGIYPPPPSGT